MSGKSELKVILVIKMNSRVAKFIFGIKYYNGFTTVSKAALSML